MQNNACQAKKKTFYPIKNIKIFNLFLKVEILDNDIKQFIIVNCFNVQKRSI